tara:strand:- start:418 stop:1206 length:789 start_codon:yes stop_codon:yes gene_type:complete
MPEKDARPIGIFDSGLGGLTVLKYLIKFFPNEKFIYLGDLANLPYGNKSEDKIIKYSFNCAHFLEEKNVKCIIIACNTASSYAYEKLKKTIKTPIFDVISPCVEKASKLNNKKIAIIGTEKTIESNIYHNQIKIANKNLKIYNIACPLFVPIVEEGLEGSKITQAIIDLYLKDIKSKKIDCLILGCTHYPILFNDLKNYFNNSIQIFHSGPIIVDKLKEHFSPNDCLSSIEYYVTDSPERFIKNANKFLNQKINKVNLIKFS